jgi:hypothetical protein
MIFLRKEKIHKKIKVTEEWKNMSVGNHLSNLHKALGSFPSA